MSGTKIEEFFDYKNRLIMDLLTNEEIVKLIDPNTKMSDAHKLVYNNVFPFEYVPETVEDAKTFICIDVDIQKVTNKTFFIPIIYVWVFSHKSILVLPEGEGVRTDKLVSEISGVINGSRYYGLGELDLYSIKRFAPMKDYNGKVMAFQAVDFNRISPTNKTIPSNRKLQR